MKSLRMIGTYLLRGLLQLLACVGGVLGLAVVIFIVFVAGGMLIDLGYPYNIFGWTWYGIEFLIMLGIMGAEAGF